MSHLIHADREVGAVDLFQPSVYEIITPRLNQTKKLLKISSKNFTHKQSRRMVYKIMKKQEQRGSIQMELQMAQAYAKIKQKMKTLGHNEEMKQARSLNLNKITQNKKLKLNNLLKYKQVHIDKKYNIQLAVKLGALKQVEEIEHYRETMQQWQNQNNNNVIKSANFNKMAYLMERLNYSQLTQDLFGNIGPQENFFQETQQDIVTLRSSRSGYIGLSRLNNRSSKS